jgi:RNA polymerase sporulation-specific sigma factor
MIGLINASKNFNEEIGVKFSTYAYTYILGEVTKYMREDRKIKVSRDVVKLKKSITKTKDYLRQKLLREPTNLEISLILEIDEEKISEIEMITSEVKSLDYSYTDDDINLYHSIKIEDKDTNCSILDLRKSIQNLSDDEKKLIYSRYYCDLTQRETSEELGISQVQVSRKETKILQKLKKQL